MKMTRLVILILSLLTVLAVSGCVASNKQLIQWQFDPEYPGYSSIKVIKQESDKEGVAKILTLRTTIEAYPAPVVCEGQMFVWIQGEKSIREMYWNTLEEGGLWSLVRWARHALVNKRIGEPDDVYQPEHVSLMLKHWIDKRLITLEDIAPPDIRDRVSEMITNPSTIPAGITNASLFDAGKVVAHDIAPSIPQESKVQVYVLRGDGTIDMYLLGKSPEYSQVLAEVKLAGGDTVLPYNRR